MMIAVLPTPGKISTGGTASSQPSTFLGYPTEALIDLVSDLRKCGVEPNTAHELFDRVVFADKHGGTLHLTPYGPRLDDETEALFIIGRAVRS